MACPFFRPSEPLDGPRPARAPLGDVFAGECSLDGHVPERDTLVETCNFGYARGRCPSFPDDAEVDAVRFSKTDTGPLIFILEKGYSPLRHGTELPADPVLRALAHAFESRRLSQ